MRVGETLADDRRFEGDDRDVSGESRRDFRRDLERLAQLGRAPASRTDRDAAWTACSADSTGVAPRSHALQKAAANASPAPVGSIACTSGAGIVRPKTLHPCRPSLSTGTWARLSSGTARVAASTSVANSTSGLSRARAYAMRDGPYAREPAAEERSMATIPFDPRTDLIAARAAAAIGSTNSEYAGT